MRTMVAVYAVVGAAAVILGSVQATADSASATPTPAGTNGHEGGAAARSTPIVISNETLQKYSERGHVTEVTRSGGGAPSSPVRPVHGGGEDSVVVPDTAAGQEEIADAEQRRYWRSLYERQLALVDQIEEQIEILDREIPGLWRDFYAHDDPMYRDGVIKPKLDDALTRRQQLETQLEQERLQLPKIREDARRAGAQPGWFRGLDSPKPKEKTSSPDGSILPSDSGMDAVTADDVAPDEGTP